MSRHDDENAIASHLVLELIQARRRVRAIEQAGRDAIDRLLAEERKEVSAVALGGLAGEFYRLLSELVEDLLPAGRKKHTDRSLRLFERLAGSCVRDLALQTYSSKFSYEDLIEASRRSQLPDSDNIERIQTFILLSWDVLSRAQTHAEA